MEGYKVAYYNDAEANEVKKPNVYDNFIYDNEVNGGILNKFTEIDSKVGEIRKDIKTLEDTYNTFVGKYVKFSNLKTTMNGIITTLNSNVTNFEKDCNQLISFSKQAVEAHMAKDSRLMADLDKINGMLTK